MCSRQRTCQKKRSTWQTVWWNFTWKGSSQFPEISQLFWHGICSALEYGQEIARTIYWMSCFLKTSIIGNTIGLAIKFHGHWLLQSHILLEMPAINYNYSLQQTSIAMENCRLPNDWPWFPTNNWWFSSSLCKRLPSWSKTQVLWKCTKCIDQSMTSRYWRGTCLVAGLYIYMYIYIYIHIHMYIHI